MLPYMIRPASPASPGSMRIPLIAVAILYLVMGLSAGTSAPADVGVVSSPDIVGDTARP